MSPAQDGEGASTIMEQEEMTTLFSREFPTKLKARIKLLKARREMAGATKETLDDLYTLLMETGCEMLEREVEQLETTEELGANGGPTV